MQNDWWTGPAVRTQRYAGMGDMRAFYDALNAVYGPSDQIQSSLRSSDENALLTDKEAILQRWSEHFEGLFNDRGAVQGSSLAKIPQVDVKLELDDPPTREEIKKATMQLKVGKSPRKSHHSALFFFLSWESEQLGLCVDNLRRITYTLLFGRISSSIFLFFKLSFLRHRLSFSPKILETLIRI